MSNVRKGIIFGIEVYERAARSAESFEGGVEARKRGGVTVKPKDSSASQTVSWAVCSEKASSGFDQNLENE